MKITGVRPSSVTTSSVAPGNFSSRARAQSSKQLHRLIHIAVRRPVRVEGRGLVGDADIVDQGRRDRLVPKVAST